MVLYIIRYLNSNDQPVSNIVGYIIAYGSIAFISLIMINMTFVKIFIFVAKLKGILSQLLYKKVLKTYYGEISQGSTSGKLSSLISSDLEFLEGIMFLQFFFSLPSFLIGSAILLWFNLGLSGILGLIVAICHLPFIYLLGKITGKYRFLSAAIGDSRMKMITNLIEGIRIVKLYGWENPYMEGLFAKRGQEIEKLKKKAGIVCVNKAFSSGCVGLVLFSTFSIHIALGNKIDASTAFSSIAVLIISTGLVSQIGTAGIMQIYLIVTSMKRFTQGLIIKKKNEAHYKPCKKHSLNLKNCVFSWKEFVQPKENNELSTMRESEIWMLKDINFRCKPGELVIVIGSVGSGKTGLFLGILNELSQVSGEMGLKGNISFASEEPWIVSGTIRENILMGLEMDEKWYNEVTKACCLEKDFELFKEYRDETVVGDRGITLSGGQKARVSLARAVYSNRDIVLLDDPLSAVDPEVCSLLFTECIKKLLSDKSVILATHQTHFVSQADKVLILEDGKQLFFGTYQELLDQGFSNYLGAITQTETKKEEKKEESRTNVADVKIAVKDKKSIVDEEMAKGRVPIDIYWKYLMLGYKNWFFLFLVILLQVIAQVSYLSVIYWIVV